MHTILGAGGAIGIPLASELRSYTDKVRLVARRPKKVNENDELVSANLVDAKAVNAAVAGSDVVYLVAGLEYKIKIWQQQWPAIMRNVINACILSNAKLVFLDNVYAYAKNEIPHMSESSIIHAGTRKGKVREEILHMIFEAGKNQNLQWIVARSADFYGPDVKSAILNIGVIDKLIKGRKAMWQSDVHKIHSFTYTPDAAKGTALLGNTAQAFNQTWHLPTSSEKWTGKDFIEQVAGQLNVKPKFFILSKTMIRLFGIFSPLIKELLEMQYQNDQDYFFDSSKFNDNFSFVPHTYQEGIRNCIDAIKKHDGNS